MQSLFVSSNSFFLVFVISSSRGIFVSAEKLLEVEHEASVFSTTGFLHNKPALEELVPVPRHR